MPSSLWNGYLAGVGSGKAVHQNGCRKTDHAPISRQNRSKEHDVPSVLKQEHEWRKGRGVDGQFANRRIDRRNVPASDAACFTPLAALGAAG
jgi:hypothetical protein